MLFLSLSCEFCSNACSTWVGSTYMGILQNKSCTPRSVDKLVAQSTTDHVLCKHGSKPERKHAVGTHRCTIP